MSRRILVPRVGGPEVLTVVDEPRPEPVLGQVRVRTLAIGVARADLLMREGIYPGGPRPPFTPGYGLIGIVAATGPGVRSVQPGDVVAALTVVGSYGEQVCLSTAQLVPVPAGLDAAEAACLVLNYVTAYQLLHRVTGVHRGGERVLVHGAAGGVGTAALEIGRLAGLEMYGTARGDGCRVVERFGGTAIDTDSEDLVRRVRQLTGAGVDVVLDGIGGLTSLRSYRALRRGGRLVLFGHHSALRHGRRSTRGLVLFYIGVGLSLLATVLPDGRRVRLYQIAKLRDRHPDWFREDLATLLSLLADGRLHPLVAERIPLLEARRAHERLGAGGVRGTLVLVSTPPPPGPDTT